MSCFAVVTGGGTAGHVIPAIAVAEALVVRGHDASSIHYVGARRGVETAMLADTPFPAVFYDVVGFQRQITRRNLGFVPKMWKARRAAIQAFRLDRPKVVVSVGGYASMPSVLAARRLRIPIVVVSYDRRPGRASTMSARRAAACAVAFPDSQLPRATLTGAPLRQSILDIDRTRDRTTARAALGVPQDRFLVAVIGGSLGSGILNDAVVEVIDAARHDHQLAIHHVLGNRFIESATAALDGSDGLLYQRVGFELRMPLLLAAADLLVGRGGASTVHEVAATGVPAILVPWAGAAEDHQTENVAWLSEHGAAVLLPETRAGELPATIQRLRIDQVTRRALGERAFELGAVHRSGALAQLVESVALA